MIAVPAVFTSLPAMFSVPPETSRVPPVSVCRLFPSICPMDAVPEEIWNIPLLVIEKLPEVKAAPLMCIPALVWITKPALPVKFTVPAVSLNNPLFRVKVPI